jgi:hypothetical protein
MNDLRVSCAALCLIEMDHRVLLEINKNRGDVLTPLGGALEFHETARQFLSGLGAVFEKGCDLRINLPAANFHRFETWFGRREQRELNPFRELHEELVEEHCAVPRLVESDAIIKYLYTVTNREPTTRRGLKGISTTYLLEIFRVEFSKSTLLNIVEAVNRPSSRLRLVTQEDIAAGLDPSTNMPVSASARLLFPK